MAVMLHAYIKQWKMGDDEFLVKSKQGVLQYVVMKTAVIVLVVDMNNELVDSRICSTWRHNFQNPRVKR
jgi:hypothetical protein